MAWLQTLHHLLNPAKVERVAASLAAENYSNVWERVIDNGVGMRPAEMRGYIRARSAAIVQQAVSGYLSSQNIASSNIRNRLVNLCQDALIRNVSAELRDHVARTERQAA